MRELTYTNPVYPEYFADPFVLRVGGTYWAYGTGPGDSGGNHFPVLRSEDLVKWEYVGHALRPLAGAGGGVNYWAPEVAEKKGKFYLYYSAAMGASDEHHRLRVAVSERAEGPFVDSGRELMPEQGFSIDASPFTDPRTGKSYLYFATDYTNEEPYGTGLAVVELADNMVETVGQARVVVRASCDWQIYERDRDYKGRKWKAWNCVEGPFVVYHGEKFYCLYSGGAWHSANYGVGFATASDPMGPWKDDFAQHGPFVLKGVPEKVIGPGHNSVVMGPDDKTLYIVYHAWDAAKTARRLCIDPLVWTHEGPKCDGPSYTAREMRV